MPGPVIRDADDQASGVMLIDADAVIGWWPKTATATAASAPREGQSRRQLRAVPQHHPPLRREHAQRRIDGRRLHNRAPHTLNFGNLVATTAAPLRTLL
jgi:hypothetical protein